MFRLIVTGVGATAASATTVLVAGDSWGTEGKRAFADVMSKHSPSTKVVNIAVGGTTADDWHKGRYLTELKNNAKNADHLWLTVGGNDAIAFLPGCQTSGKSAEECGDAFIAELLPKMESLLEAVHEANPNIKVVGFGYDVLGMNKLPICPPLGELIFGQCNKEGSGAKYINCWNTQFTRLQHDNWAKHAQKYDHVNTVNLLGTLQASKGDPKAAVGAPNMDKWSPQDLMESSCIHANNKGYEIIFEKMWELYWSKQMGVQEPKQYAKGFVRMPRNEVVEAAEITQEMRDAAPAKLDWTTKGATSSVKDQGSCGSCWAFSATEGIESGVFMTTGKLPPALSTQQIISCDKSDLGCNGGDLPTAFQYVQKAGGIDTASDYPDKSHNTGRTGICKSHSNAVEVTGYKYAVPPCEGGACKNQDEDGLKAALNTYGPLSVCVNAGSFNSYYGGVLSGRCSGSYNSLDHCVQLVGYDTTASKPYWKVKNSWNTDWGEKGFIRLPMGQNSCGIADEAMYVTATMASTDVTV